MLRALCRNAVTRLKTEALGGDSNSNENLMIIELNDDDTRLLHTVLLEQAQEHLSYADTSEVADRLYRLANRFERPQTWAGVNAETHYSTALPTDRTG
jgi:hypothetical protein